MTELDFKEASCPKERKSNEAMLVPLYVIPVFPGDTKVKQKSNKVSLFISYWADELGITSLQFIAPTCLSLDLIEVKYTHTHTPLQHSLTHIVSCFLLLLHNYGDQKSKLC